VAQELLWVLSVTKRSRVFFVLLYSIYDFSSAYTSNAAVLDLFLGLSDLAILADTSYILGCVLALLYLWKPSYASAVVHLVPIG
jgi:hypothetical protein